MTDSTTTPVVACCSALYGSPLAELLVGRSLHPGGLAGTRDLLRSARLEPGARLLDVGCGLGASAGVAADQFGLDVTGVDASAPVIERAASLAGDARVRWSMAALPHLPFADDSFDAVLSECVLSTVDRPAALREIARILRPGGALLLSDVEVDGRPIPALDHRIIGAALCVTDAWRPGEMDTALADAGFAIEERSDHSSSIIDLADRIEARLTVAHAAARDLGLDLGALTGPAIAGDELPTAETAREIIEALRDAVREGTLGYTAVIARIGRAA